MSKQHSISPEDAAQRRRELLDQLEAGFQQVQQSDDFRRYLDVCARFHHYSPNNVMLILMQRPDAQQVAGFHSWLNLKRSVRKGEKGIRILAPQPYRKTIETEDGEEQQIERVAFKVVHVFDVAQTEGEALPELPVTELTGIDERGLWAKLASIAAVEGLSIDRSEGRSLNGANGWYDSTRREIWVKPEASPLMATKTLSHELGHHFADHKTNGHCREERETIAEAVAYVVLGHYGIDAGEYSFGYLATWTDLKTFRAKLAEIQQTASTIIDRIERKAQAAKAA